MPELEAMIERRRTNGLDRYDEWWKGVYHVVGGPSPERGVLSALLVELVGPRARSVGLQAATTVNLGIDKVDTRTPDIGVFRPDTERTSRAYLATAELVVEIMSPDEIRGAKLDFYAEWNVTEYLEVGLPVGTIRLLANRAGTWEPIEASEVIDLTVAEVLALLPSE